MKHLKTLRKEITKLIEDRMAELEISNIVGTKGELWPGESLCTLVNPLCPDDHCWLPYGHVGTEEAVHVLGTTSYPWAERVSTHMYMAPEGTDRDKLRHLGWEYAEREGWN